MVNIPVKVTADVGLPSTVADASQAGAAFRGIAQVATQFRQEAAQKQAVEGKHESDLEFAVLSADYEKASHEVAKTFELDDDYDTQDERWVKGQDALQQETLNRTQNPRTRRMLELEMANSDVRRYIKFTDGRQKRENTHLRSQGLGQVDSLYEAAGAERDPELRATQLEKAANVVIGMQQQGLMTPEEAEKLEAQKTRDLAKADVMSMIEADPLLAQDAIRDGKQFPGLTPEDRRALLGFAIKERSRDEAETVNDLYVRETRGQLRQSDLEAMLDGGEIDGGTYAQFTDKLRAQAKADAKAAASAKYIGEAVTDGRLLDPGSKDDREAADSYYLNTLLPSLEGKSPEEANLIKIEHIAKTGVIPPSVESQVGAIMNGGSPQQKAETADFIMQIADRKPPMLKQLKEDYAALAISISDNMTAGMSAAQAIEAAESKRFLKDTREYKDRASQLSDKANKRKFDESEITRLFRDDPSVVPVALKNDWEAARQRNFLEGGMTEEAASRLAYKQVQGLWTVSNIGAAPRWQKYAPEVMYGNGAQDADWMREQLLDDVRSVMPDVDEGAVRVEVDPRSDLARPSYLVTVEDADGVLDVVRDENNQPLRWRPQYESSSANRKRMDGRSNKVDGARTRRQQEIQQQDLKLGIQSIREGF